MEREEGAGREGGEEGVTGFITFELCLKKKFTTQLLIKTPSKCLVNQKEMSVLGGVLAETCSVCFPNSLQSDWHLSFKSKKAIKNVNY